MSKHTGADYRGRAAHYAARVDASIYNAHYERPAVISLLPPLREKSVLDVGCGSGWYAEHLLSEDAIVTAFDFDEDFVALTEARVQGRARVLQADLAEPLAFAEDESFDLVVAPLVLHYLHDWLEPLKELRRVLKPGGHLVFSTHHPFNDWKLFEREDYFAVELLEDEWDNFGKITFYRRPLTVISSDLADAGFFIDRLLEPRPTQAFEDANPSAYRRLCTNPWFLAVRARKR